MIFKGRQIVKPEELEVDQSKEGYKVNGKYNTLDRDIVRIWKRNGVRLSRIGLENQSIEDRDMPFRVIGYDGASYRAELNENINYRYGTITITLHFGKRRWVSSKNLKEIIYLPEEFDIKKDMSEFIIDYKANVVDVAYLTEEEIGRFKSDFQIVADFMVQERLGKDYIPLKQDFLYAKETLELLSAMSGDDGFEKIYKNDSNKGEIKNMCVIMDRAENKGFSKGEISGFSKGEAFGFSQGVASGFSKGENAGVERIFYALAEII